MPIRIDKDICFICLKKCIYPVNTECLNLVCLGCINQRKRKCPICSYELSLHSLTKPFIPITTSPYSLAVKYVYSLYNEILCDSKETKLIKTRIKNLLSNNYSKSEYIEKYKEQKDHTQEDDIVFRFVTRH